ncbi:hypothetical protein HDV03_000907 [Kappamyces sp. JEL0829]|nr:hypothetical protein HDV03_000907 [Kappamyces sp. JEL0829]
MNPASSQPRPVPQSQQQFKLKARKREAVQKYEPEIFRDELLALLPANPSDLDAYCVALEQNEGKLDMKRYAEPFFEIFIVGPGGVVSIKERNPFSIFEASDTLEAIKARVSILMLKYFPKKLEETLSHLLTYVNKFGANTSKLASACGLFAASGLVSIGVLEALLKEHLTADGTALNFLTKTFQAYLSEHSVEHLTLSLKKADLDWRLSQFFPTRGETTSAQLTKHFSSHQLKGISDYVTRQQGLAVKDQVAATLKTMFAENKAASEIVAYLRSKVSENNWPENEIPSLIWSSLMSSIDWSSRGDQIEGGTIKILTQWGPTIALFCTSAKSELALLLHLQAFCYDDSRFLKHFRIIVQHLYKHDALSESAILYWYSKGASAQGKNTMLSQLEPFVNWLKAQDSDDEDE